jgi:hypothetical protein
VDKQQPSPGEWAMMAGGLVALIGSFLTFGTLIKESSSWGEGFFLIATLIPIYCVAVGVLVALSRFANVNLPAQVLGFTWSQIHLVLGIFAALMALCWIPVLDEKGAGLWVLVVASLAVAVGAVMNLRESATRGTLS